MEPYIRVAADDRQTQELDNNVNRVFQSLYSNKLLNNPVIVTGLTFVAGTNLVVNHKLNRPVTGFIPINLNAASIIYQSTTTNATPKTSIILKASANVTADILFF